MKKGSEHRDNCSIECGCKDKPFCFVRECSSTALNSNHVTRWLSTVQTAVRITRLEDVVRLTIGDRSQRIFHLLQSRSSFYKSCLAQDRNLRSEIRRSGSRWQHLKPRTNSRCCSHPKMKAPMLQPVSKFSSKLWKPLNIFRNKLQEHQHKQLYSGFKSKKPGAKYLRQTEQNTRLH